MPALAIALWKALESSLKADLSIGPRSEIGILRLSAGIWFSAIDKMEPLNVGLISKLESMELSFPLIAIIIVQSLIGGWASLFSFEAKTSTDRSFRLRLIWLSDRPATAPSSRAVLKAPSEEIMQILGSVGSKPGCDERSFVFDRDRSTRL